MNKTFSFQRFILLLGKHWSENKKRYGLSVLAYMGMLFMWFGFIILTDEKDPMAEGLQQVSYLFPLLVAGAVYASQFYSALASGPKAIAYLMVPASSFEKLLCGILYSIVAFFIVYTLAFYLVDAIVIALVNTAHPSYTVAGNGAMPQSARVAHLFVSKDTPGPHMNLHFFFLFVLVQATYLLGSVYFARYSLIKTAISSFVILMLFFLVIYLFTSSVLPHGGYYDLTSFRIFEGGRTVLVQTPEWLGTLVRCMLTYGLPSFLWAVTYFRLKEKQV
jgi:hypothetical protein